MDLDLDSDLPPCYSEISPHTASSQGTGRSSNTRYHEQTPLLEKQYNPNFCSPKGQNSHRCYERLRQVPVLHNPWPRRRRFLLTIIASFLTASTLLGMSYGIFQRYGRSKGPIVVAPTVRVAIIGAGPAGIGAAWAIGHAAREGGRRGRPINVDVTVFERKLTVGGRMVPNPSPGDNDNTFLSAHFRVEDIAVGNFMSSGSVLKDRVVSELGEKWHGDENQARRVEVGYFDGENMRAKIVRPYTDLSWKAYLCLVARYWLSITRAKNLPDEVAKKMDRFLGLYGTFGSIGEMIESSGLGKHIGKRGEDSLKDANIGDLYKHDVIGPQLRRQLVQGVEEVSELSLAMALQKEKMSSLGSEKNIETALELLLAASGAGLKLGMNIQGLDRRTVDGAETEEWICETSGVDGEVKHESFDHVIIAAPLDPILQEVLNIGKDTVSYRSILLTLVAVDGPLSSFIFGPSPPDEILPIPNNVSDWVSSIHEVSHVREIYGPDFPSSSAPTTAEVRSLYRIMSTDLIPTATVEKIFGTTMIEEVYTRRIGDAWPLLWPRTREEVEALGGFEVPGQEGVWWTGAYEAVMSGIDEAWVVGENVGRLVMKKVLEQESK